MLDKFKSLLNAHLNFLNDSRLLIAISGGIDSIVLTHACNELGLNVSLAHCNFKLRARESDGDEQFVRQLASQLGLEIFVKHFNTESFANEKKISTQMAARDLRYMWFKELAQEKSFDYILTAHHADDDLETFLINFSRGTGLDGLLGIPQINENVVRPLLDVTKEDIEVYAVKHNLKWRDDSSNASTKYLRNKLRHDVIPTLKNINPTLLQNFQKTQSQLEDVKAILNDRMDEVMDKVVHRIDNNGIQFNIKEILKLNNHKAYVYQLFKKYKFNDFDSILDLLVSQSGKIVYSEGFRLVRDRDVLILTPKDKGKTNMEYDIQSLEQDFRFEDGILIFRHVSEYKDARPSTIYVDLNKLRSPLKLRHRKAGDFFYPIGLNGKKKVSKYFKDKRFSLIDKERSWLLCSGVDIVWVVGHRLDNRFKVTDETVSILQIEFRPTKM